MRPLPACVQGACATHLRRAQRFLPLGYVRLLSSLVLDWRTACAHRYKALLGEEGVIMLGAPLLRWLLHAALGDLEVLEAASHGASVSCGRVSRRAAPITRARARVCHERTDLRPDAAQRWPPAPRPRAEGAAHTGTGTRSIACTASQCEGCACAPPVCKSR